MSILGGVARLEVGVMESTSVDEVALLITVLAPVIFGVAWLVMGFCTQTAKPVFLEVVEPRLCLPTLPGTCLTLILAWAIASNMTGLMTVMTATVPPFLWLSCLDLM